MQPPGRGQIAAVLVRIRIADHHFLMPALADLRPDFGHREITRHDVGRLVEIGDRLEQRHDHQVRSARRLAAAPQSGFAREDMDFEQVGQGLRHADDPLADRIAAQPRAHVGGGMDDRQLARRLVAPLVPRRGERPVALQLGGEQRDARLFVQRQIVGAHARHLEQLGEHALVHRAVLPHVERRKVEPEHFDRADQPPERADPAELALAVRRQPVGDGDQVAAEIGGGGIGLRPSAPTAAAAPCRQSAYRSRKAAHKCPTAPGDRAHRGGSARHRRSPRPAPRPRRAPRRGSPTPTARRRAHAPRRYNGRAPPRHCAPSP